MAAEVGGLTVQAAVAEPASASRVVDVCLERFGRLDALVISSGAGAGATVLDQTLERWNNVIATNLTAAFLLCQAALPALLDARGAIVTVSSLAGLRPGPASAAYCPSQPGLILLPPASPRESRPAGAG